jgi:hypothetical protein
MEPDPRHSRRLTPSDGRDSAVLRHQGREDVALIVNLSSEGFRVCTYVGFPAAVGDTVRLETADGHHTLRVKNVEEQEGKLFLGLERLHDSPLTSPGQSLRDAARLASGEKPHIEWGVIVAYVILPLAIGLAILISVVGTDGLRDIYHTIRRNLPG